MTVPRLPLSKQNLPKGQRMLVKSRRNIVSDAEDGRAMQRMLLRRAKSLRMKTARVERMATQCPQIPHH
jgi:hypothetical protein